MLGTYENFPSLIHFSAAFAMTLSRDAVQQKLIKTFRQLNGKELRFEDFGTPAVPEGIVVFMFGIADTDGFKLLGDVQTKRLQETLAEKPMETMDWFLAIRYYKNTQPRRTPLKFDYYLLRLVVGERDTFLLSVSHEKGPRYISPEDVTAFIIHRVNGGSKRKTIQGVVS